MPATRAVPAVGVSRVQRIEIVVDFPAPFGPRKPNISPWRTSRSIPRTASTSLYRLTRPSAWITASTPVMAALDCTSASTAETSRVLAQALQQIRELLDLWLCKALEHLAIHALKRGRRRSRDRQAGGRELDRDQSPVAAADMPDHHALG